MTEPEAPSGGSDLFTRSDLVIAARGAAGSPYHLRDWGQAVLAAVARVSDHQGRRRVNWPLLDTLTNTATCLCLPATPFEGMLEAPRAVIDVYQAHKQGVRKLVETRTEVLGAVLHDLAQEVIEQLAGATWRDLHAHGATRERPPSPPVVDDDLMF